MTRMRTSRQKITAAAGSGSSEDPAGPRVKVSLDELVNRIALDIQSGVYVPGTWLKQVDLEARYQCTRIDLRRALDQLVANRLVEHVHNRGYHVYEPDSRVYAELQDIRVVLELYAAELIGANATPADVRELRRLAKRFDELLPNGTVFEQYEANVAFHRRMLAVCPNRELASMIMEIRRRGPSAPIFQWKTRARMEQSSREHLAMVDAIEARQPARLQKLLREHIQQTESADRAAPPTRLPRKAG